MNSERKHDGSSLLSQGTGTSQTEEWQLSVCHRELGGTTIGEWEACYWGHVLREPLVLSNCGMFFGVSFPSNFIAHDSFLWPIGIGFSPDLWDTNLSGKLCRRSTSCLWKIELGLPPFVFGFGFILSLLVLEVPLST